MAVFSRWIWVSQYPLWSFLFSICWCVEESKWRKKSVERNMATKTQMDRSRAKTWRFSTRYFWR